MNSVQHIANLEDIIAQLHELEQLRELVRKAELAARRSLRLAPARGVIRPARLCRETPRDRQGRV